MEADLEFLALVPPPPLCWGHRCVPAHLAQTLVLKALHIFVCITKDFKWSAIPNLDEYNMPSDYTKMILRLICYHCTVYIRSKLSYWD